MSKHHSSPPHIHTFGSHFLGINIESFSRDSSHPVDPILSFPSSSHKTTSKFKLIFYPSSTPSPTSTLNRHPACTLTPSPFSYPTNHHQKPSIKVSAHGPKRSLLTTTTTLSLHPLSFFSYKSTTSLSSNPSSIQLIAAYPPATRFNFSRNSKLPYSTSFGLLPTALAQALKQHISSV